jgi:4-aminobutyrate aminotransferase-like enzyme
MSDAILIQKREQLLGPAYRLFYDEPLHLVRGEGVWLYAADGSRFLDMYNNVPHVGHCHPRVVAAIARQAALLNTHTRYLHENVVHYAERLTEKCPDGLDTTMFCCTGSEANELALRIARAASGGEGIIVTDYAYHGNTRATYEISTEDCPPEQWPPHVVTVPNPDCYRGQYSDCDDAGLRYAEHVQAAVDELQARGIRPAALIMDTIISSGGIVAPAPGYLSRCAEIVRAAGGLFIADEVQPGFGRTGQNFWGFEADGVIPDIMTLGKPMANGHPAAGIVAQRKFVEAFSKMGNYFNTFGGNPVSCAAALAVLDVIEEEGLQQNAEKMGDYMVAGLRALAGQHPSIGDVRGSGLFVAVELVEDRDSRTPASSMTASIVNELRHRGVLTSSIGRDDNILKFRPPMVIRASDIDLMLEALDASLRHLAH